MNNYNPKKVLEIYNSPQFKQKNLNWVKKQLSSGKYNKTDLTVAHVLRMERTLIGAANELTDDLYIKFKQEKKNLEHELYTKPITSREALKRLKKFNDDVGKETLYETLPLYFSPDLKNKNSIFLDKKMRSLFYESFLLLLKQNKIKLSDLKKEYMYVNDHHHLMPLNDKFIALEKQIKQEDEYKVENELSWSLLIGACFVGPLLLLNGAVMSDDDELNTKGNWKSILIGNVIFVIGLIIIINR